ncbi:MAG: PIN domain-like protein, partial [Olpidium bornovanus]
TVPKQVISDGAPSAILNKEIKHYFGRKVAIDASMSIYQFLIAGQHRDSPMWYPRGAVRQQDGQVLTNEDGAITRLTDGPTGSHLMGLFYRTLRMVDNGIKPVYVFDGKPPSLKTDEPWWSLTKPLRGTQLAKRLAKRDEATAELEKATETGKCVLTEPTSPRRLSLPFRILPAWRDTGNVADMDKFGRRTVKVTKEHNDECKRLLRYLGIPYVEVCQA